MPRDILVEPDRGQRVIVNPKGSLKVVKATIGPTKTTAQVVVEGTYVEPTPPPADQAPTISVGPILSGISPSGVKVDWTLSEAATGQVEHRRVGQTVVGATPPETTLDYRTHTQLVTGLSPDTPYELRAIGKDSTEQAYASAWIPFRTLAVVVPPPVDPPPAGALPPETTLRVVQPDVTTPRPGYLQEIEDPYWKTKIRRITDTPGSRNGYSTQPAWNEDMTLIHMGYGGAILDAKTYAKVAQRPNGVEYAVWSSIDPRKMYGVSQGRNVVKEWTIGTPAWVEVATFPEYGHLDLGGYSGNVSDNDRIAFITNTRSDMLGMWGAMVYDAVSRRKISSASFYQGSTALRNNGTPTETQMSRSGEYVTVCHNANGTGPLQGTKAYKASDMSFVRHMADDRPHSDNGRNAAGEDIFVFCAYDYLKSHRYRDGQVLNLSGGVTAIAHVSCANYKLPGFAFITCNRDNPGTPGNQQLIAVPTDASGKVRIYGFTHQGGNTDYNGDPMGVASPDGRYFLWGVRWNESGDVLAYVAHA